MNNSHRSDPALVQACVARDQRAWEELVDRYSRLIYSIPRRYGMSEADADDVHQNVFRILAEKLEQLQDQTRLSSWLITTAHRECWRLRRNSGEVAQPLDGNRIDDRMPQEEVQTLERRQLVRQALNAIGSPCRDLLQALFLEPSEGSYEQIAARLGMKVGSIGPTRARCLEKMAATLKELGLGSAET
jgi:RNA polymerase sigma factor (sigma-70 family)